jgi:protein-tyrosine phosphatase
MPVKVLMVCLGNICRSPLAQGILQSITDPNSFYIDSAGTGNYHIGKPPDYRSIKVAAQYGINIESQKCRQFTVSDFDNFDYILAMDEANVHDLNQLARNQEEKDKIHLLLKMVKSEFINVPDPYYGTEKDFEYVFNCLHLACVKFKALIAADNPIS